MTTTQQTKVLEYSHTMGMTVMEGKGFYYPVDAAVGKEDRLYVISRSREEVSRGIHPYKSNARNQMPRCGYDDNATDQSAGIFPHNGHDSYGGEGLLLPR